MIPNNAVNDAMNDATKQGVADYLISTGNPVAIIIAFILNW